MAQKTIRVFGRQANGSRVSRSFRDNEAGRAGARTLAADLVDHVTMYDVRTRIGDRVVTRTFKRSKDADAYVVTIEADKLRGIVVDPRRSRVTLRDFSNAWLEGRHDLAQRTRELYRYLLDTYVLPELGSSNLGSLTPSMVRSWHVQVSARHASAAAKAYRLLRQILTVAVSDEVIARNPCQVKGGGVERAKERPIATVAQVQALAEAMPSRYRIAVLLATWCQLRRGELLGLRRRDVDQLRWKLTVDVTRVETWGGRVLVKPPKTEAGRRTIAIPPNIRAVLAQHLANYVGPAADAPLLVGERGDPLAPSLLRKAWVSARTKVGRPDLHLHDLRHTGATFAAATGASTKELMARLGHSSPVAALRYQHATEDRDEVLANALSALADAATVVELPARSAAAR